MSSYSSRPTAPMERSAAVEYLKEKHGVTGDQANDLLTRATQRVTGMASLPRRKPGERTLWATHMTTQGGRFIIEVE